MHVQNKDVTEAIQKVAAAFDCKIAEGVLSHQMKQFVIDANKVILSVTNPETRVDDAEFEENEVYAIDIVTSTGDGKVCVLQSCTHICVCGHGVRSSVSGVYCSSLILSYD